MEEIAQSSTPSPTQRFDWGASAAFNEDLREQELYERLWWFVRTRWVAAGACMAAGGLLSASSLPLAEAVPAFVLAALLLAASNAVYIAWIRRSFRIRERRLPRRFVLTQMAGDFLVLGILTYAAPPIRPALFVLFVTHVLLATLFFERDISAVMTGLGATFAAAPLVIEHVVQSRPPVELSSRLVLIIALVGSYYAVWFLCGTITETIKAKEHQLEAAHRELVRLDREKSRGTLRATHELKAPFAAIKSYVYTLRDGYCGPLPDKAQEVVMRIGDRCDRLMEKITDIIQLSNLKTLEAEDAKFETMSLRALTGDVVRELMPEAEAAGVLLKEPYPVDEASDTHEIDTYDADGPICVPGPTLVRASAENLRTLILNLARNAIAYSPDGGRVDVSVIPRERTVTLRVRDQGIGIAQKDLPRIFEEHFRSNEAVRKDPSGNGMGLAIVKEVARLHGASIEVSSEIGRGTEFLVHFDAARETKGGGVDGANTHRG
ncbi:HAMP domain-containing histidine kinase [bacterium]|nr:HAMP domain-containing histidine kinase [bacterium]